MTIVALLKVNRRKICEGGMILWGKLVGCGISFDCFIEKTLAVQLIALSSGLR